MMIKLTSVHALVTYKFPEFAEFNERSKSMQIYRQKQIRNLHTLLQENLGREEFQKCSNSIQRHTLGCLSLLSYNNTNY